MYPLCDTPENTAFLYRRHCGYKPIFILLRKPAFTYISAVVPATSRVDEKSTFRGLMKVGISTNTQEVQDQSTVGVEFSDERATSNRSLDFYSPFVNLDQ